MNQKNYIELVNKVKECEVIKNIEIKYLENIIPTKLYTKLHNLGMKDIQSILETDEISFSQKKSVGTNSLHLYETLRKMIITDPDLILKKSLAAKTARYKILPIEFTNNLSERDLNLFKCFSWIVDDYFDLIGKIRDKDIVYKRFGLKKERVHTLEELGGCPRIALRF
jgi:hypothetical protein